MQVNIEKIITLYKIVEKLFLNPSEYTKNSFIIKKFIVLYNKLFHFCLTENFSHLFFEKEIQVSNYCEFQNVFSPRTLKQLLENDFSLDNKYNQETGTLVKFWQVLEKVNTKSDFFLQKSTPNLTEKLSDLIVENDSFTPIKEEIFVLIERYNFLLKKTYQLKFLRNSLITHIFVLEPISLSTSYLFLYLFSIDREIFRLLSDLIYFRATFPLLSRLLDIEFLFPKENKKFEKFVEILSLNEKLSKNTFFELNPKLKNDENQSK